MKETIFQVTTNRRLQSFGYDETLKEIVEVLKNLQAKHEKENLLNNEEYARLAQTLEYLYLSVERLQKIADSDNLISDKDKLQVLRETIALNEDLLSIENEVVHNSLELVTTALYQIYAIFTSVELVMKGGH